MVTILPFLTLLTTLKMDNESVDEFLLGYT
jgi:hypothetical protein